MRLKPFRWMLSALAIGALANNVYAQIQVHVPRDPPAARVSVASSFSNIRMQTTAMIPDRGSASLGGYSLLSSGRNEFGVPGIGKVPYVGRPFGNVGYGRAANVGRVNAAVRIIDIREEEFRQTGVRSR
jgi:type II secretory pathway component GspD/PulD (secretin)